MTEELFRQDSYLKHCDATVIAVTDKAVVLDKTVFYPTGGGQPGDSGHLILQDGRELGVTDTRKDRETGQHLHILADDSPLPAIGETLTARIDWERRYRLMRMHTALHLLCASVPCGVTGGQIGENKSRLDFDISTAPEDFTLDKEVIGQAINSYVARASDVDSEWISDAEMDAQPDLVRTMSVQPPRGAGQIRLIRIGDIDLQPCGGTHLSNISEVGTIIVGKIESKGKRNKRVNISLEGL